jgi:uncharacterized protein (TIGR02099 family)
MKRLGRAIEMLAWGAFFAVALSALALRYWVLPDIERFREEIVAAMSHAIGLPVRVGSIEAGWLGLRPHITLTDVRIQDAQGREALALPSIENVVAWRSLLRGELRLDRLVIERPRLSVRRDAAGQLYVAGLRIGGAGSGSGGFGGWIVAQKEVEIRNAVVEWHDELRAAPPLVLSNVQVRLLGEDGLLSLGVSASPPAGLAGDIDLRALLKAHELDAAAPSGRVFLQVGDIDLAAWRPWLEYPFPVRQGHGALRVWTTLERGRVRQSTADLALAGVRASLGETVAPLELATLRGRLRGRGLDDGAELSARGLSAEMEGGRAIAPTDFEIVWRPQAGGVLAAGALDLEVLRAVAGSLPLPPQLARSIESIAPQGRLAESRLEWSGPFEAPKELSARLRFEALALRARDGVPGVAGLSGSLEATLDKGQLSFSSHDAAVELPGILPQPNVALDSFAGELEWRRDGGGGYVVTASSISFANEHLSGNLFGAWSGRGEGPGRLELSAILGRADASAVERYLPHGGIMGEAARKWVAAAVVAGEASDVRVRVSGELRDFPFTDPSTGEFRITAHVEKGVLDYAPGWPRIEDIAAELTFERDGMEVVARGGSILGARLADVRVRVPSFKPAGKERSARVLVSGRAEGPTAEFLKYVEAAPLLREATGGFTADMRAEGGGKLRLKLELPIAELDRTEVSGDYDFAANKIAVLPQLPPIEDARGRVTFTANGFSLNGVRGRLLGGALSLQGGAQKRRGVDITARGEADFAATRELFDHPLRSHLSGSFPYAVSVQAKAGRPRVVLRSSLGGLESTLPAPLAKSAGETLPLRIELVPTPKGERDRILVTLGKLARAEVSRRRQGETMEVQRTAVWLSPAPDQAIRLPERPGTLVYGALPAFDLDRWLPLFSGGGESSETIALDLKLATLDAFGRRFGNVALRASAEPAGWSANLSADELAGDVSYQTKPEPRVIARLARFAVPADTPGAKPQPAQGKAGDLPALDLVADEFTFRGKELGRVELVARRDGDDWRVENASMSNPDATLTGRGVWRAATSRTAVEFDLHAADVGEFLGRVGHADLVKGGRARLQGALDWQGDPATLDFPSLAGTLELHAEEGQFLEIEPGLGKLVSLMSLQALPRRVTLDFRDVFSKGFQFDRISSAAQVEKGVIQLKEFRMRGSAADVEMTGAADVARETQDLRVRVVPSLGDTAALGLTLVNPVAGIAAAVVQRLLKNPLGQIFSYDYAITGSWSDPRVAKIEPAQLPEPVGQ